MGKVNNLLAALNHVRHPPPPTAGPPVGGPRSRGPPPPPGDGEGHSARS